MILHTDHLTSSPAQVIVDTDTCTSSAAVAPLMRRTRSLSCAEEIFQITPRFFKTKGLIYEMFDNGISPDIKMFTSAESVISLSCLLTFSLDSSHVCNRFAGLKKKWHISGFLMTRSTAEHIYHRSSHNMILTFLGGVLKTSIWSKKAKKGDTSVT